MTSKHTVLINVPTCLVPTSVWATYQPTSARLDLHRGRVRPADTIPSTFTLHGYGSSTRNLTVLVHVIRPDRPHIGVDLSPNPPIAEWSVEGSAHEGPFRIVVSTDARVPGRK